MFQVSVRRSSFSLVLLVLVVCLRPFPAAARGAAGSVGIFEGQSDVGLVTPAGTALFQPASRTYTLSASGANIWGKADALHFVWKKMSGNLSLTADIVFPAAPGNPSPHRKAVLMFRQTLDADAVYADAAQHGSGMTALQYRGEKSATTQDIELNIDTPKRVRLEKRGDTITMFLSNAGEPLHQAGASIKLHLAEPFYVGIGVCSHNKDVTETAVFSNVELKQLAPAAAPAKLALYSTLQTISIADNFRRAMVVRSERGHIEAPNWTPDGKTLIFNQDGRIWRIPATGGAPEPVEIGSASDCTGSHGLSPDGKLLAITCVTPGKPGRRVYIVPIGGGTPRLVTENPDSYFHSWSPDGKTILFTRPFRGSGNILSISVEGGPEKALTTGSGISDDPDFSPDGKWVYFNSDRSGIEQIWRMRPDGSQPEQVTHDGLPSWTPHPSPDGKSVVFFSYEKGTQGHPANNDVALRILSTDDMTTRVLVNIVGGAGSMNVPDWAPDSKQLAFVSFQMLPENDNGSTE